MAWKRGVGAWAVSVRKDSASVTGPQVMLVLLVCRLSFRSKGLKQELANYSLQAKSRQPPAFLKKKVNTAKYMCLYIVYD